MFELDASKGNNNKKFKIEAIWDSVIYAKKLENYLLGFYYLLI